MGAIEDVRADAITVAGASADLDPLLEVIGDARIVLLGESSHGTHEFYRQRALLTRRLLAEKQFAAIAVEGDFPDCARVSRFVKGVEGADATAVDALAGFRRFPQWMWRNQDVLDLVGWLRDFAEGVPEPRKPGFYGLDLYSLHSSMEQVLEYLDRRDPSAAKEARHRFSCFERYGADAESYGWSAALSESGCEEEALQQLLELRRRHVEALRAGAHSEDDLFEAEQNARVVAGAERYYRSMMIGRDESWNLRDTHMADTLDEILTHLGRRVSPAKIVVWAHNSHIGDARATGMGARGELNLGQLVRERHGREDTVLIGFTTSGGTVTAAREWGGPAERRRVREPIPQSWEAVLSEAGGGDSFVLPLRGAPVRSALRETRLERFIGVLYLPETERWSHYATARLAEQFDALVHTDVTRAVEPLERTAPWIEGEEPETYPTGL